MSLRQSGFWCDVCNAPVVMEMALNKPVNSFSLSNFKETFHYHDECKDVLVRAVEAQDDKMLPAGSPVGSCIRQINEHNAKVAAEPVSPAETKSE